MHLLYLDHAGSVEDPTNSYVVLAGISVFERQTYWVSKKLDEIAARFNPAEPSSIELHGSPMRGGRGAWRAHPVADRLRAITDALALIPASNGAINMFAVAVERGAVSPEDPICYAFEQVCSRFDHFLMRLHKSRDTQRGIIVFDKASYENTIQSLATDFREIGHRWGVVRNLSEVPLFLDSKASRLIQLADLVAYAVFRHYEKADYSLFRVIENSFDSHGGVAHGLVHKQSTGPLRLTYKAPD